MVSNYERRGEEKVCTLKISAERRQHRRHDLEHRGLPVHRHDPRQVNGQLGTLVDVSAGGVRVRTRDASIRPETQIRVRLELPEYAGVSPFVDTAGEQLSPKRDWVGWMTVRRVTQREDGTLEIAGPLEDMQDIDRGMLGLYLSTQPLAA